MGGTADGRGFSRRSGAALSDSRSRWNLREVLSTQSSGNGNSASTDGSTKSVAECSCFILHLIGCNRGELFFSPSKVVCGRSSSADRRLALRTGNPLYRCTGERVVSREG